MKKFKFDLDLDALEIIYTGFSKVIRIPGANLGETVTELQSKVRSWGLSQDPIVYLGQFTLDNWVFGVNQADLLFLTDITYMEEWQKIEVHKPHLSSLWKKFCLRNKVVRIRVGLYDDKKSQARIRDTYEC